MRIILWIVRMLLRRTVGIAIGLLIWVIFGRGRTGRSVKLGVNLLRRLSRF